MSKFPSRTDIVTAMRNPQVSYKCDELIGGTIIQKGSRVIQYSGGYTTVFPFNNQYQKKVAVRLWIADIGNAKERSLKISNYLEQLNHPYFAGFKYVEDAVLVNGNLYPIVVMDWVEGLTLKDYINEHITDGVRIKALAENFKEMVIYFHEQHIAHGDLQHGNILVKSNDELMVIDYDSMYVEPLNGMPDVIKGLPGYQHPSRSANKLINEKLDYFSELVIYLSLLVYIDNPALWNEYYETEDILFSKEDLDNPASSVLINRLLAHSDSTIVELTTKLKEALNNVDINQLMPLEELLVNKLEVIKDDIFSKWGKQPNPPTPKVTKLPNALDIMNKF